MGVVVSANAGYGSAGRTNASCVVPVYSVAVCPTDCIPIQRDLTSRTSRSQTGRSREGGGVISSGSVISGGCSVSFFFTTFVFFFFTTGDDGET